MEVFGSNLDRDTCRDDKISVVFHSITPELVHDQFFSKSLPIHHSSVILPFNIIQTVILKAS
jgi:hypothetical protein